jgi:O-succinylbenzoate synthase
MRLLGIELVRMAIPFRVDIGTAAGVHATRALLFVRVVADESEGWGECAALGERTAVDPSVDEVEEAASGRGIRRLLDASQARGGQLPLEPEIAQLFGSSPVDRMLGAVFEMAVADAELRLTGRSLAQALEVGPGYEMLPVGAAVGIPPEHDVGILRDQVTEAVEEGAARIRIKIEPGWDTQPVAAIRGDHPTLVLQVDANGSYRLDDADRLGRLAEFDVLCVEQPLPPADLVALAEFARRLPLPVCLDESLSSPRRVRDALRNKSCRVACLKPARLGGIRATRLAHAACVEAGVPVFVGGFFEAGLGRASNLALAARLAQDAVGLVGDLSRPASYLERDPCGYPDVQAGWVRVPGEPGVGSWPNEAPASDATDPDLDAGLRRDVRPEMPPEMRPEMRPGVQRRWFPAT